MTEERINHPSHYGGDTEFEAIKLIEDWGWGYEFCMATALKYVVRAHSKGQTDDDYQKSIWYLERATKNQPTKTQGPRRLSPSAAADAHGLDQDRTEALKAIRANDPWNALYAMRAGYREYTERMGVIA